MTVHDKGMWAIRTCVTQVISSMRQTSGAPCGSEIFVEEYLTPEPVSIRVDRALR